MTKKILLIILIFIVALFALTQKESPRNICAIIPEGGWAIVQIEQVCILAEVVTTTEKGLEGLSGRDNLPEGEGMIFIFENPGSYGFWMKDMLFAIDIIWIDENLTIVDIAKDVKPDTYPESHKPAHPAQYVLEVSSGFSEKNNLNIGETIQLNLGS